jgi:hypothetical protein
MQEPYQDPALLQEFLIESEELLQGFDQDLLGLESSPEDEELLNRLPQGPNLPGGETRRRPYHHRRLRRWSWDGP